MAVKAAAADYMKRIEAAAEVHAGCGGMVLVLEIVVVWRRKVVAAVAHLGRRRMASTRFAQAGLVGGVVGMSGTVGRRRGWCRM